jgi:hypothetical protein
MCLPLQLRQNQILIGNIDYTKNILSRVKTQNRFRWKNLMMTIIYIKYFFVSYNNNYHKR